MLPASFPTTRILFRICLLKSGPQDMRAARELSVLCFMMAFVVSALRYTLLDFGMPIPRGFVDAGILTLIWLVILKLAGRMDRVDQSISALLGTMAVMSVITLPLVIRVLENYSSGTSEIGYFSSVALFGIVLWEAVVISHIVRQTLEVKLLVAVVIMIAITFTLRSFISMIFGVGP